MHLWSKLISPVSKSHVNFKYSRRRLWEDFQRKHKLQRGRSTPCHPSRSCTRLFRELYPSFRLQWTQISYLSASLSSLLWAFCLISLISHPLSYIITVIIESIDPLFSVTCYMSFFFLDRVSQSNGLFDTMPRIPVLSPSPNPFIVLVTDAFTTSFWK